MPLIRLPARSAVSSTSPSLRSGFDAPHPVAQRRRLLAACGQGLVARHGTEAQHAARPGVRQARHVGGDHGGDLGVATDGLRIDTQHDRLAGTRHLHRPRHHAFGNDVGAKAGAVPQHRPLQAQPHAVGLARDAPVAADEQRPGLVVEEGVLRPRQHAQRARRHARRRVAPAAAHRGPPRRTAGRRHAARGRRCRPARRARRWNGCPAPAARRRRRPTPHSRCRRGRGRSSALRPAAASGCATTTAPARGRPRASAVAQSRQPAPGEPVRRRLAAWGRARPLPARPAAAPAPAAHWRRPAAAGRPRRPKARRWPGGRCGPGPGSTRRHRHRQTRRRRSWRWPAMFRAEACLRQQSARSHRRWPGRRRSSAPRRRDAARPGRRRGWHRTAPVACDPADASHRGCAKGRRRTCVRRRRANAPAPPFAASLGAATPARPAARPCTESRAGSRACRRERHFAVISATTCCGDSPRACANSSRSGANSASKHTGSRQRRPGRDSGAVSRASLSSASAASNAASLCSSTAKCTVRLV